MGVLHKLSENIKHGIRSWLNVTPANPYSIQIHEVMDFELNAIRNRIWYRGDGNELEQMYQQNPEYADKYKFWASRCTPGMEMRKIHTGLPGLIVKILASIVLSDMGDFDFPESKIRLDDSGKPVEIYPYEQNVATRLIEDFMLAANETVAEEYALLGLPFVYRTHDAPDGEKMEAVLEMVHQAGVKVKKERRS